MARRLGDPRALWPSLADQENAWHGALRPDGPGAAVAASAELDRLAADLDDEDLAYQASRARAGALLTAGDLDGVERLAEGEARLAETGAPHHRWLALRLRASTAMLRGNFADSERLAGVAFDLGRRHLGGPAILAHGSQLVFLRWLQGRPGEVEALLERLGAEQPWARRVWPRLMPLAWAGQPGHGAAGMGTPGPRPPAGRGVAGGPPTTGPAAPRTRPVTGPPAAAPPRPGGPARRPR
ncbi:MAG: hypothetical protein ACJ74K_05105 [Actinomycetes bacterium]